MRKNVIFRCDGASHIGLGHVMRCLALADGLRRNGFSNITFMSKDYDNKILDKIRSHNFSVETMPHQADLGEDLRRVIEVAQGNNHTVVIADSYDIDSHYLKELKSAGLFVMCIDDKAQIHFSSDVVLNQNVYALDIHYSIEPYTTLLLGTRYTLLRKEFSEGHEVPRSAQRKVRSILVIMGGSDPNDQTSKTIDALANVDRSVVDGVIVHIVVGIGGNRDQLSSPARGESLQLNVVIDPDNLSQLMVEADIAICAGGSTCYELACLGIPSITMSLADNQKRIAKRLCEEGIVVYLGYYEEVSAEDITRSVEDLMGDYEKRKTMSTKGRKLVDGQGVERVVKVIKNFI